MEHAEVKDLLEAYALGALEPAEADIVAAHLTSCPSCREELAGYRRLTDAFPDALTDASPLRVHPSLGRRVLARVQAPSARRRPMRGALWPVAAAVLLLLSLSSVAWAVHLNRELTATLNGNVPPATAGTIASSLSPAEQERVLEVIDSPTTVRDTLKPVDPSTPAYRRSYGRLWTRTDGSDVVVMVNFLPPPAPGQHYELVLTANGHTTDAGRLQLDRDGFAMLLFKADHNGPRYQRCVVTLGSTPVLGA